MSISVFASRWMCVNVRLCRGANFPRHEHKKKRERSSSSDFILDTEIYLHVCEVCNISSAEGQICCCSLDPPLSYKASTLSLKGRASTLLHYTFTHTLNRSFPINQHLKDSHWPHACAHTHVCAHDRQRCMTGSGAQISELLHRFLMPWKQNWLLLFSRAEGEVWGWGWWWWWWGGRSAGEQVA